MASAELSRRVEKVVGYPPLPEPIEQRPGVTPAERAEQLGVTINRVWQIVRRLEAGRVSRRP